MSGVLVIFALWAAFTQFAITVILVVWMNRQDGDIELIEHPIVGIGLRLLTTLNLIVPISIAVSWILYLLGM